MGYWSQKWISFEIQGVERQKQRKFEEQQQLPPTGAIQKELLTEKDHEEVNRWAKRKRAERKKIKQKKEGWLQSKINNLNVSQKLKKKKQTKKSCEVGFKT